MTECRMSNLLFKYSSDSFAHLLNDEEQSHLFKIELSIKSEGKCYRSNEASGERVTKGSYCFGLSIPGKKRHLTAPYNCVRYCISIF